LTAADFAALPLGQKLDALITVTIGGNPRAFPLYDFLVVKELT
jgi:hypothetical protein